MTATLGVLIWLTGVFVVLVGGMVWWMWIEVER